MAGSRKEAHDAGALTGPGREQGQHLGIGTAGSPRQGAYDQMRKPEISHDHSIGIAPGDLGDMGTRPGSDSGEEFEPGSTTVRVLRVTTVEAGRMSPHGAQGLGAGGLDSEFVIPPCRMSEEPLGFGWKEEITVGSGSGFSQVSTQAAPLAGGLARGHPLSEDDGEEIVGRGAGAAEPGQRHPAAGSVDHRMRHPGHLGSIGHAEQFGPHRLEPVCSWPVGPRRDALRGVEELQGARTIGGVRRSPPVGTTPSGGGVVAPDGEGVEGASMVREASSHGDRGLRG